MTKSSLRLETQKDITEIVEALTRLNNISRGRDLVWLLNPEGTGNNAEAIERWLRNEIWERQRNCEDFDIGTLSSSLERHLNKSLMDLE